MSMATARTSDDAEVTYRRPTSYDSTRSTFSIATPSAVRISRHNTSLSGPGRLDWNLALTVASFVQGRLRFICLDLPSIPFSEDAEFGPPEEMIPCEIPFVDRKGDMITVSAALARTLHRMGCYALAEGNFCPFPQDVDRTLSLVFHVSPSPSAAVCSLTGCDSLLTVPGLRPVGQRDRHRRGRTADLAKLARLPRGAGDEDVYGERRLSPSPFPVVYADIHTYTGPGASSRSTDAVQRTRYTGRQVGDEEAKTRIEGLVAARVLHMVLTERRLD